MIDVAYHHKRPTVHRLLINDTVYLFNVLAGAVTVNEVRVLGAVCLQLFGDLLGYAVCSDNCDAHVLGRAFGVYTVDVTVFDYPNAPCSEIVYDLVVVYELAQSVNVLLGPFAFDKA